MPGFVFAILSLLILAGNSYGLPPYKDSRFDPNILKIEEDNHLGKRAPDIRMVDDKGNPLTIGSFAGKPLIISIIYYVCPHSCKPLNEGLAEAVRKTGLKLGADFNVLTISFNEKEGLEDARKFREALRTKMLLSDKLPEGFDKWVFAIATDENIKALTEAAGYRFFYSAEDRAYIHPNVYIFLSPEGKITRYIFGLYPAASDIRLALVESANGRVGKSHLINAAVLACYRYDSSAGGYTLNLPLIFGGVGISMLIFTLTITYAYSRRIKRKRADSRPA